MQMKALRSRYFAKLSSSSATSEGVLRGVDLGRHAGRIVLEPDAVHASPAFLSRYRGRAGRFGAIVTLPRRFVTIW